MYKVTNKSKSVFFKRNLNTVLWSVRAKSDICGVLRSRLLCGNWCTCFFVVIWLTVICYHQPSFVLTHLSEWIQKAFEDHQKIYHRCLFIFYFSTSVVFWWLNSFYKDLPLEKDQGKKIKQNKTEISRFTKKTWLHIFFNINSD